MRRSKWYHCGLHGGRVEDCLPIRGLKKLTSGARRKMLWLSTSTWWSCSRCKKRILRKKKKRRRARLKLMAMAKNGKKSALKTSHRTQPAA